MRNDELMHYGTKRHSGRYPWGSGENPYQRDNKNFLRRWHELKSEIGEVEAAKALGMTMREARAAASTAKKEKIKEDMQAVYDRRYKAKMSPKAIAEELGLSETTVRNYLKPSAAEKLIAKNAVKDMIKKEVDEKGYVDVSKGANYNIGITQDKLEKTCKSLRDDNGYALRKLKIKQLATGQFTTMMVLCKPGTTVKDAYEHVTDIKPLGQYTIHDTDGTTKLGMLPPKNISMNRVKINYADTSDGGQKDGLIELRRGVPDLNLGNATYAQVRIAVDDKYYLKGVAAYGDPKDFPKGVDIIFNTSKTSDKPIDKVLKELKTDTDNVFGATILQDKDLKNVKQFYYDKNGEKLQSALNVVNEEGKWDDWSKNLASQMLSKQSPELAKKQLNLAVAKSRSDLDDIMHLTNPTLQKKLLEEYANGADADAAHLKAAALPRQSTKLILPITSLKDNEVYAPSYRNGESVVLIRYPHQGIFEIPELKVNNHNTEGRRVMGTTPTDAIGINANVAARLSGADFDGDTVLVIPVKTAAGVRTVPIKTAEPLAGLKNWDETYKKIYKLPDDAPEIDTATKNQQMGIVTNLITDMSLKGASLSEIERATKHAQVIIDSQKHHLDYKKSAQDQRLSELHEKWQGKKTGGASTIVSRAEGEYHAETVKGYYKIDKKTGEKIEVPTGDMHLKIVSPAKKKDITEEQWKTFNKIDKEYRKAKAEEAAYIRTLTPEEREKYVPKVKYPTSKVNGIKVKEVPTTYKTTKMASVKDAYELTSNPKKPNQMEAIYADYANSMKSLANEARKKMANTEGGKRNPAAAKTYAKEVESLDAKLVNALKNAPKERQAQIHANSVVSAELNSHPEIKQDSDKLKRLRMQALNSSRALFGADKKAVQITITENEWKAIQANAISATKQREIFDNCDSDYLKKLATPKINGKQLTTAKIARIKSMKNSGYTMQEIADDLGVSTSTVSRALKGEL